MKLNLETKTKEQELIKQYLEENVSEILAEKINNGVKIVKNKVSAPFKNCQIDIIYGKGISKTSEILEMGVQLGLLKKSGSWFEYNGNRFANGKEAAKEYLNNHLDLMNELEQKIKTGEL